MFFLRILRYLCRAWLLRPLRLGGRRAKNSFEQHSWKVVWAIVAVVILANASHEFIKTIVLFCVAIWILLAGWKILLKQAKKMLGIK